MLCAICGERPATVTAAGLRLCDYCESLPVDAAELAAEAMIEQALAADLTVN